MVSRGEPQNAAEWMARLRHEKATAQDQAAYEQWMKAHPAHGADAADLDRVWQAMEALEHDPMVQDVLATSSRPRLSVWQRLMAPRPAAGLLFSLCLALMALFTWQTVGGGDTYRTASGEQRIVYLEDGSKLHLNVATELKVRLRQSVRTVQMVRGQAFFEINSDPSRPFVVTAGDKEITVLGTKFDVLLQGDDTRVTVIEGRVAVTSRGAADDVASLATIPGPPSTEVPENIRPQPTDSATSERLELTTHDAISWPRSASPSPLAATQAIAAVEAWRSGKVVFDRTPLQEAVEELDRYTPMRVRLDSDYLGATPVSGVFYVDRLSQVDALIFALESSLPITVQRQDDALLLVASN